MHIHDLFQPEAEEAQGISSMPIGWSQALGSGALCQQKRQWAQRGAQYVPSEYEKYFSAVQVTAHWHSRSLFGDVQKPLAMPCA